jgi:predicted RNase H-like nuclease (RuvC/YqgF family)
MNPSMLKAMKVKKKRAVDPNAPPRPNLLQHDVKLRGQQENIETMSRMVAQLNERVQSLESKLRSQTIYLQALHAKLANK